MVEADVCHGAPLGKLAMVHGKGPDGLAGGNDVSGYLMALDSVLLEVEAHSSCPNL